MKHLKLIKWSLISLFILTILGLFFVKTALWFDDHQFIFQSPIQISFYKPVQVVKRELLRPQIIEVYNELPQIKNLTPIEEYICDKFGPYDCKTALSVARAESGMNCQAIHANSNGSVDFSIFQVNSSWLKNYSLQDIVDCYKNVDIAFEIWDRADGEIGNKQGNFSPWVAFNNGLALKFMGDYGK